MKNLDDTNIVTEEENVGSGGLAYVPPEGFSGDIKEYGVIQIFDKDSEGMQMQVYAGNVSLDRKSIQGEQKCSEQLVEMPNILVNGLKEMNPNIRSIHLPDDIKFPVHKRQGSINPRNDFLDVGTVKIKKITSHSSKVHPSGSHADKVLSTQRSCCTIS
jgi:hypothetical protein